MTEPAAISTPPADPATPPVTPPVTPPADPATPPVTPPVTPPADPAVPPITPPADPVDWKSALSDDHKTYIETKGFKDPSSVLESYVNLEKLLGKKENLITIPEKADDPLWADVHKRLGKPEKAEDYKIGVPEGGDDSFAKFAQNMFHEANLSNIQAEHIINKFNEFNTTAKETVANTKGIENDRQEATLKTEWGAAFNDNIAMAKKAAMGFGMDAKAIDALETSMGYAGVMKFMHNIGSKMGEDSYTHGGKLPGFNSMTPESARSRIKALKQDTDFTKRYLANESQAKEEMEHLQKCAAYTG